MKVFGFPRKSAGPFRRKKKRKVLLDLFGHLVGGKDGDSAHRGTCRHLLVKEKKEKEGGGGKGSRSLSKKKRTRPGLVALFPDSVLTARGQFSYAKREKKRGEAALALLIPKILKKGGKAEE